MKYLILFNYKNRRAKTQHYEKDFFEAIRFASKYPGAEVLELEKNKDTNEYRGRLVVRIANRKIVHERLGKIKV